MGKTSIHDVTAFSLGRIIKEGKGWRYFSTTDGKTYLAVLIGGELLVLTENEYRSSARRGKLFEEQARKYRKGKRREEGTKRKGNERGNYVDKWLEFYEYYRNEKRRR